MMMQDFVGQRYQILKKLGEGGMADVYVAQDTLLHRDVALKVLRGSLALDPVALLRFQREAHAASALSHPNIVEIYDVGEEEGQHYIVMELIRGKTLKQLILQRGALEKKEALAIMEQLVEAVREAHLHNIIHRDIKPQNILIKDDGTVKITDFGIATVSDALQLTQTDTVLGSVHYLAPELARGESSSFQSDIYALGITFYEMLTGELPFKGEQPVQVAMKHLKEPIPSVQSFNPSLPMSIENIIIKATAKNRTHRYKHADAILDDLKQALNDKNKQVPKLEFNDVGEDDHTISVPKVSDMEPIEPEEGGFLRSITGISLVLVSIFILIFVLSVSGIFDPSRQMVEVPDLTNLTVQEAKDALFNTGIELSSTILFQLTDDIETGKIFRVSPSPGTLVERGSIITVSVSEGMFVVMEDYQGLDIDTVRQQLQNLRINVRVEYRAVQDIPQGRILEQSLILPGTKLDPNRLYEVKFVVAAPIEFLIPQLVGVNIEAAKNQLEALGAVVYLTQRSTDDLSEEERARLTYNVVIAISPEPLTYYRQGNDNFIELIYYRYE
jgi:eukaryotic-like serine/threonine-protein kinase